MKHTRPPRSARRVADASGIAGSRMRTMLLCAMAMLLSTAAQAMKFTDMSGLFGVLAEGEITDDTPAQFAAFTRNTMLVNRTLWFNSPGGSLSAGLALGRELRR